MNRASMYKPLARGVAAALLLTGVTIGARAQSAGAGGVVHPRDTVFFRHLQTEAGKVDSVMVIVNALQREPMGSTTWLELSARLDSLLPAMARVRVTMGSDARPKGWIGINVGGVPMLERITPAGDFIRYMVYPDVVSVEPDSPASRAGIAPGDVLVAYNGVDVVEHEVNRTLMFVPDKRMLVTVRRDGENRDFTMPVAKVPEHVFLRRMDVDGVMPAPGARGGQIRIEGTQDGPNMMILPGHVNGAPGDRGTNGVRANLGGDAGSRACAQARAGRAAERRTR
jgi:membrane-associated protease RseP (regulator of RpoE activity)